VSDLTKGGEVVQNKTVSNQQQAPVVKTVDILSKDVVNK
jgi:hypothetical protein